MKRAALLLAAALVSVSSFAKDIKTLVVTTTPQMHCANCEKKIKENLRFEKGVKNIATDIESQTVTVEYDADKNKPENIIEAFGKFGYTAKEVVAPAATEQKTDCGGGCCASPAK